MPLFRRKPRFAFEDEPTVETKPCQCCNGTSVQSQAVVRRGGDVFALYWLVWYPEHNEGWLDAALGPQQLHHPDRVTFGCRIGAIEGQVAPACSLVPGAELRADDPFFGQKLSPEAAREHPWIRDFWALTDWIMINDRVAHDHLYHFDPTATPS